MIRLMGLRKFWVSSVRLPGDTLQRAEKDPHVAELAESIRELGVLSPPHVWILGTKRKVLLTGRDVVAALCKLGIAEFQGLAVEATPEEAYRLFIAENTKRKQVSVAEAEEAASPLRSSAPFRLPPPDLPDHLRAGLARDLKERPKARPPEPELRIVELGMELTETYRERIGKVNTELARAQYYLACAAATYGRIKKQDLPMHAQLLEGITGATEAAARQADGLQPYAICPWCKGLNVTCKPCGGARWVTRDVFRLAAPKLHDAVDKVVLIDGVAHRLKDVVE